MAITISVTEAARNFSDLINRVNYQGQTFLLTRGGKVVARLAGTERIITGAESAQLWQQRPRLDPEDAKQWERELAEDRAALLPPEDRAWDS